MRASQDGRRYNTLRTVTIWNIGDLKTEARRSREASVPVSRPCRVGVIVIASSRTVLRSQGLEIVCDRPKTLPSAESRRESSLPSRDPTVATDRLETASQPYFKTISRPSDPSRDGTLSGRSDPPHETVKKGAR